MRILSVRLSRLGAFLIGIALVALTLLVLAAPAGAQTADGSTSTTTAITNLVNTAQLIGFIAGWVIPFVVALLVDAKASPNVKTFLAFIATGLTAIATYVLQTSGAHTWVGAASVFVVAFVTAAASQKTFTQQWVDKLLAKKGVIG